MSSILKVQALRDELSKRGLDTTGLKPALVARLDEAIASEAQTNNAATKDEEADKTDSKETGKKKTRPRDGDVTTDSVKRIKLEDIDKLNANELKSALTALDMSVAGSQAALKKRLKSALQGKNAGAPDGGKSEDDKAKMVTATKKGRAVLDPNLPEHIKKDYHVLEDGDEIYDAMLNQTNVGGNNNKYYVIQALENDAGTSYQLFTRWGRVGAKGQQKLLQCASKDGVLTNFANTFQSKTCNDWHDRHTFTSFPGKYTWLEMDYDPDERKVEEAEDSTKSKTKAPRAPVQSKLDPQIQKLISTICSISMMKQEMAEIGYDARKMPLGKLSKSTILKGYEVLKRIAASLEDGRVQSELEQLTSEFYTVIPHDFGFKKMRDFIIDTPQLVKKKLEMVEALGEIEVATKILEVDKEEEEDPLYHQYQSLKCAIEPVVDSDEAAWIKSYLANTHGETHYFSLSAEHIFKVVRDGEDGLFQPFAGAKNRMLLWHGSRMCNWMGILSQGLRIAPPEAPVSGYMFGKGVYFADMVSKSAQYCYPGGGQKLGLLLLCEVALGDMRELENSDYHADRLPPGKLSTKGLGVTAPDPKQFKVLPDGVIVPMGKPAKQNNTRATLAYNEYIVYNTSQIRMKYLLMVKFKDKQWS